jgi:hypothetical protein
MMKPLTGNLSLLAGLALIGAAGGITLGHSAVSEINPVYYAEAPSRFHGDQVPQRPDWTQPQPALADASAMQGLGNGCFGCSAREAEFHSAPAVVTYTDSWRADAVRAAAPIEPAPLEEAAPDPERERVVRYASYPITEAQVVAVSVPAPAEAEVVQAAVEYSAE